MFTLTSCFKYILLFRNPLDISIRYFPPTKTFLNVFSRRRNNDWHVYARELCLLFNTFFGFKNKRTWLTDKRSIILRGLFISRSDNITSRQQKYRHRFQVRLHFCFNNLKIMYLLSHPSCFAFTHANSKLECRPSSMLILWSI